jgi:glycosyltransferase involved in cell wall biosynthesis
VAHYTTALLSELARVHSEDEWVLFLPGHAVSPVVAGPDPSAGAGLARAPNVTLRRHRLPGRVLFAASALAGRPRLDRLLGGDLDILWAPAPAPLAVSDDVPFVLTVHDLSFLERPRDFTGYERLWHRLARPQRLVDRAARVIAVSRAVGETLRSRYDLEPDRLAIVPSGVSAPAIGAQARKPADGLAMAGDYLLCVGALEPRKDPELLLRAFARARADGLPADLVFAGAGRLRPRLHGPGVHVLGHVPPAELDRLYAGALALVMPSWHEGFGLPPLEALARGTPAVVSDLPVYDETLGRAALRFPAGDESRLAEALMRIAADAPLRSRLVEEGQRTLSGRTWEAAARRTRAVLAEAAGGATAPVEQTP